MRKGFFRLPWALVLGLTLLTLGCESRTAATDAQRRSANDGFLIRCEAVCDSVAASVEGVGGRVTHRYRNLNALAANLPADQLRTITALVGQQAVVKDVVLEAPKPVERVGYKATPDTTLYGMPWRALSQFVAVKPTNYSYNNRLTGAARLHRQDQVGDGIVVAVIDTGTANNPEVVPTLAGSVIGGENFVPGDEEPAATSTLNDPHGTWIGTMIAGHGLLLVPNSEDLVQSLLTHAPDSVLPLTNEESLVPLVGTAPGADIYAIKAFPADGSGAPASRVLAAMDRVLTLKRNYDAGVAPEPVAGDGTEDDPYVYDALNVQVVNLSVGGHTLFAGQELEDLLTQEMLAAGITVIAAFGNDGFAALTGGSPGTGSGALTVGAANSPVHERVLRDLQLGLGQGLLYRPNDHVQTAVFSARGPTADGRLKPEVIANGFGSFVQGADGHIAFVSGTSLSAPTVAGAAALLQGAFPEASATAVRGALIESADDDIVGDQSGMLDQGFGFIDIAAAFEALAAEEEGDDETLLGQPAAALNSRVQDNLRPLDIRTIAVDADEPFTTRVRLVPGQVVQFFVPVRRDTHALGVAVEEVLPELPAEAQNALFGDDVILSVVDAPTSFGEQRVREFVAADTRFEVLHPQEGLVRVALMGDWTNAGAVSAKLVLTRTQDVPAAPTFTGNLLDGELDSYTIDVAEDTPVAEFFLGWKNGWGYYPTHDLDLILIDPEGNPNFDGATLASPERVVIEHPMPGTWTAVVEGFMLHDLRDRYQLRVAYQVHAVAEDEEEGEEDE